MKRQETADDWMKCRKPPEKQRREWRERGRRRKRGNVERERGAKRQKSPLLAYEKDIQMAILSQAGRERNRNRNDGFLSLSLSLYLFTPPSLLCHVIDLNRRSRRESMRSLESAEKKTQTEQTIRELIWAERMKDIANRKKGMRELIM